MDSKMKSANRLAAQRQAAVTTAGTNAQRSPQTTYGSALDKDIRVPQKPTTSTLQTNKAPANPAVNFPYSKPRSPVSPTTTTTNTSSEYSPRLPQANLEVSIDQPALPIGQTDGLGASEKALDHGDSNLPNGGSPRKSTVSPVKAHSYSQLRNVSSPLPQGKPLGNSSPPSPRNTATSIHTGASMRSVVRPMPRTSSIDSAISTISLGGLHGSLDSSVSTPADITSLIQTAGSAEALIQHLLKEKQHSAAQNAQLWRLVDKQRSLVLGLNQDLERALQDKDRYRKKLRDHLDKDFPVPAVVPVLPIQRPRSASVSPAPSEASADLPIQRQSFVPADPQGDKPTSTMPCRLNIVEKTSPSTATLVGVKEGDWVRSKPRSDRPCHSHKATSSSDVGIFSPDKPALAILELNGRGTSPPRQQPDSVSQPSPSLRPVVSPATSFTAKRSQPFPPKSFSGPALALTNSATLRNDVERMTPPRKAPPAPLDLGQRRLESLSFGPEDHSGSDYDENTKLDESSVLDRGRKKTREEDDREREAALLKEKQDRSRSKKAKNLKHPKDATASSKQGELDFLQAQAAAMPSSIRALAPEPTSAGQASFLAPPASLADILSPCDARQASSTTGKLVPINPISPGLPLSPRPNHRPINPPTPRMPRDGLGPSIASPPISPKSGPLGLPLSPRAPRHLIPLPPNTPTSLASPTRPNIDPRNDSSMAVYKSTSPTEVRTDDFQTSLEPTGIYRGLESEAYPGLLLPPNALPSIIVKVDSSRFKTSRHSFILKGSDEEPVFTLGVSARSDLQNLWQVEKPIQSLQQLDQQLRQSPLFNVKPPDRSLFHGHAPIKVDARKVALEKYFESVLDTPMDEKSALALCQYLSTQVAEPTGDEVNGAEFATRSAPLTTRRADGRLTKEGYLTKRGKNFGGWKARFFVLEDPILRYYETPSGSLLGTIKLPNAKIGKNKSSQSPSGTDEGEGHYRHAFLIREPKRKDSSSVIDHILCAESDAERDSWVEALLCYVEDLASESGSRPPPSNDSGSTRSVGLSKKTSLKNDSLLSESPDSESFDGLLTVPYENTRQAEAPHVRIMPDPLPTESPSPTTSGSQPSLKSGLSQSKAISGPQNGAKISDVGAWGNKPMAPPLIIPKESKKRGIWGFRDKNASDIGVNQPNNSDLSLTQQQYQEQITNVKAAFGAPLAEAVEYCGPHGVDVCLPAVVYRCLEYLNAKNAASEEGIFRLSGSNTLIKNLRYRFNAEGDFDFLGPDEQYFDVHAVASLLKWYLRELPQPVLTRELHLEFISVLDLTERERKIAAYNVLVHRLPRPNFTLLRALSEFLISVVEKSEINKMSIRNVGIVFSPTLNIPAPVFSLFLTEFDVIFSQRPIDSGIPSLEFTSSEALTPEDIRSPRRQMFSNIPTPSYTQDSFSTRTYRDPTSGQQNQAFDGISKDTHQEHDIGFIPLQSAYQGTLSQSTQDSITVPAPEYAIARSRNPASASATKAWRRESSMLLMGSGQRKSSMPTMMGDDMLLEECVLDWAQPISRDNL